MSSWGRGPYKNNAHTAAAAGWAPGWAKRGCKTLPPLEHELCEWLVMASLCPYLVSHFNSSLAACTDLGLHGSECKCGVCTMHKE